MLYNECILVASVLKLGEEMMFEIGIALNHRNQPFRGLVLQYFAFLSTFLRYALAIISALLTHIISWLKDKN
jgi:hypothetical protein